MNVLRVMVCGLLLYSCHSVRAQDGVVARVKSHLYDIGSAINDTQIPIVGKMGDILPFAVTSFCLQKFPEQTMVLIAGCLLYAVGKHDKVGSLLQKYSWFKKSSKKPSKKMIRNQPVHLEDDFFIFDGDDLLDAQEQEEDEDEFLFESDEFSEGKQTHRKMGSFL